MGRVKSSWRVPLIAGAAAVVVLTYVLGQSIAQLRGSWPSTRDAAPAVVPDVGGPRASVESPPAANAPPAAVRASSEHLAEDAEARSDEHLGELASDAPRAGPPTGEEFARLLEDGLIEDADPAAVEAYRRALRERDTARE